MALLQSAAISHAYFLFVDSEVVCQNQLGRWDGKQGNSYSFGGLTTIHFVNG